MDSNLSELQALGLRLRSERLKRNESQAVFAARVGISMPTLRKMENGDPAVQLGSWFMALHVLDRAADLSNVLASREDLFAKYERLQTPVRKRASRGFR